MEILLIIGLILIGFLLVFAEIFFIPGITVCGIAGGIMLVGGIVLSFTNYGPIGLLISLTIIIIVLPILVKKVFDSKKMKKMSLDAQIRSSTPKIEGISLGDKGITISRLNPIGIAEVNGRKIEAKSSIGFIEENIKIEIIEVSAHQVIVKRIS